MKVFSAMLVWVVFMFSGCGESNEKSDKTAGASVSPTAMLEQRIMALENANRDLQSELNGVQQRYEALQVQVASLANSASNTGALDDLVAEAFQKHLAATEERQQTQQVQRRQEFEERRKQEEARRLNDFGKELALNDEQKEEVKVTWEKMGTNIRETWSKMRNDGDMNREKITETMEKLASQHSEAMKKILSEEQFVKYDAMEESVMQRFQSFRGGNRGAADRGGNRGAADRGGNRGANRGGGEEQPGQDAAAAKEEAKPAEENKEAPAAN